jgi:predicted aspartyl protease
MQEEPNLTTLMPKIFLAYGGRDSFAQLDKNYTMIGKQKTLTADGTASAAAPADFRQLRKGTQLKIEVEPGGDNPTVSTVYDGMSAFKATGKIVDELDADQAKVLAGERDHEPGVLSHFEEQPYTFQLIGRTTFRASPVYAIAVVHGSDSPVTVYVDEKNYLVDGVSYKAGGKESSTVAIEFQEYRPFGGTMVPYRQIQYVDDKPSLELDISSVDLTTEVEDSQFGRPDRPYDVRLSKAIVVPFDYSHKEIVVSVSLNGSDPQDFLLDTAASQTVVDRHTAAENFLDKQGTYTVTAVSGAVPTQISTIKKFSIGDMNLSDTQALILDLSSQMRQMGKHISGIIGANVLSKFAVTIDFAKSQIIFNDAATYKPPAGATLVPFSAKQGPVVKAVLNGNTEIPFLVDTGAAFNNLPSKVAAKLQTAPQPHTTEGTGLDGRPVHLATVNVAAVRLGSQTLHGVNFTYSVEQDAHVQSQGFMQAGTAGVLGNPFWQNFALTLDYKFQRLVLQTNQVESARQDLEQLIVMGDSKLTVYRDLRATEAAYQKALMRAQTLGDAKQQARIWGRLGDLHRIMAKDLSRPEQARIAYEYFSKAQELAHKRGDREVEGRILGDWSLLYMDNGQMPAARQALEGATMYAPQDAQVNVDFAVYLYKLQLYSDMQKFIEKALFLDPANWQALWYKVKLAELFNDSQQLKDTLKEIIKHYPWSKIAKDKLTALTAPPPSTTPPGNQPTNAPPVPITPP